MKCSRALKVAAAVALLFELLMVAGPAAAQRRSPPTPVTAAAAASGPGRAYVLDPFAPSVTVFDTTTYEIVAVIPVGFFSLDLTASPDGSVVYVASLAESTVYVIDTATNTVTTTIPVGPDPQGIAFSPDSATAYVVFTGGVTVIDVATSTVTTTIPLAEGSFPVDAAVSPDGSRLYVTVSNLNAVVVIDTSTNTVVATIAVGESPSGVVFSPNGSRAYVTNSASNTVSVINTATNSVIATIPVGAGPMGIDIGPEGSQVYVVGSGTDTVTVIDTATNTVTDTLVTGIGQGMTVDVTARRVYVGGGGAQVVVIDRVVEAVIARVDITPPDAIFTSSAWSLAVIDTNPPPTATPTVTTQASASNLAGTFFSDTATLTGGATPTGEVIFSLYRDSNCLSEAASPVTRPLVNGTATAEVFIDLPGTYYWRALYTGDANNNPATHPCNAPNESVVVRPFAPPPFTRTISGDFVGPLTVNAGDSVQLLNARVVGPVTVNPGGSLVIVNSDISRGIVANSPGFLTICGSRVAGPRGGQALGVFDADVPIIIGNAPSCAGNRFSGDVNLIGNATTTFNNNIVVGNVTVNNNGPGNTQLRQNNVTATLACSGNTALDPTRPAVRNIAGARSGQCVAPF